MSAEMIALITRPSNCSWPRGSQLYESWYTRPYFDSWIRESVQESVNPWIIVRESLPESVNLWIRIRESEWMVLKIQIFVHSV